MLTIRKQFWRVHLQYIAFSFYLVVYLLKLNLKAYTGIRIIAAEYRFLKTGSAAKYYYPMLVANNYNPEAVLLSDANKTIIARPRP